MSTEGGLLKISSYKINDTVALSIADTGPGIAEDIKNKIFEPYL